MKPQEYIDQSTATEETFEEAFREYVGPSVYKEIKGTTFEELRKSEFAAYLVYLQGQADKKCHLRLVGEEE